MSDMTAAAIPVNAPHGRGFYATVVIVSALFCCAFAWGASGKAVLEGVRLDTPMGWRLVQAGIAALFLVSAMQAFERLLAPARAQARSARISGAARARLLGLRTVLLGMGVAGSVIDVFVRIFRGGHFADIVVLSGVFCFAGYLVADFCGERR
jgi:hypothetical protein